jgi:hypothetical protein
MLRQRSFQQGGVGGALFAYSVMGVGDHPKTYFFELLADRVLIVGPRLRRGTQENGLIQRSC